MRKYYKRNITNAIDKLIDGDAKLLFKRLEEARKKGAWEFICNQNGSDREWVLNKELSYLSNRYGFDKQFILNYINIHLILSGFTNIDDEV